MLTVLMASHNGGRTLKPVLEAFTRLQSPSQGWKLVVVDNASTDNTRGILCEFQKRLPLTFVTEERQGKNFALNTGLEYAEGDLAVFTDDDVFPNPDWLVRLRAAADANAPYSMFGGVIRARWEVNPPVWVDWVNQAPMFTVTDHQLITGPTEPGTIFGPNMAIRMDIFKTGIRFDPSIGPSGVNYAMGSESELLERLGRLGYKAWHAQDAIVEHFVRASQLEPRWMLGRAFRHGRGSYRIHNAEIVASNYPWHVFPSMFMRLFKISKAFLTSDDQALFCARYELNYLRGCLAEARNVRRQRHN